MQRNQNKDNIFSGEIKPATFEDCLKQYERMIKSIMKKLGIFKMHEEYYQIGQIALWVAYEKHQSEKGSFSNYAFLTVRGHLLNELSKESKYEDRFVVVDQQKEEKYYTDEACLFEDFISHLDGISPIQQKILIERFYLNKSFSEIATKFNMQEPSIRSSYRYALKRLRNKL
ncbi:sigma-70 family RNA polymerase sigma factor [Bacillus sp. EAC]|uniref:sigma-70 family RNA polymerase sigma factor n=1 Tax=Bacillus sp. EAC TaxID=1978338 RepID=UPI000B4480EC|nr:sigma-70 family RNA polymerase sigma factor [Bacillus sp. EAC]